MLHIHTLTLGNYQTNTYIVHDSVATTCCIIDPGCDADTILHRVTQLGLTVDAIVLTHGHFDHVGAVQQIVERTRCQLWMSEGDWSQFPNPVNVFYYPLANCDFTEVHFIEDDEVISAGGAVFHAISTPGHTRGSACLLCGDALFSGDTLFAGSCGRTDLPGGDRERLAGSLKRLAELEGDYRVYPGHGSPTTLLREKKTNPYMPRP